MYQALYRKYRPKTLEEICGQDTIVKIIKKSVINNHINHAYLFSGPRGTGKTSIAKVFAKMVNCENLKDGVPCGHCVNCTQSNNSDIVEIDAASNNGVDEIRELRNKVNLVPSYGRYKVYIIDEVHMLTTGAFNALLKTLEEPPAHVIFILATTDPHKIPETILSRCQRLDFKRVSENSIVKRLKEIAELEKIDIEEEALKEIARLSDGGMRDSIGMLDQAVAYSDEKITTKDIHDINGTLTPEKLKTLINYIIQGQTKEILEILDKYSDEGKNFVKLTEEIITFMRNILLYKNALEYFKTITSHLEIYEEIAKEIDNNKVLNYIQILNKTLPEMKMTTNPKLLLELAIIQIISENKEGKVEEEKQEEEKEEKKEEPIKPEKMVEEKTEPVKKEVINKIDSEELEKLKNVRIENTLAKFTKKQTSQLIKELENFNKYLLDKEVSKVASIIQDGTLKAASDQNLIFVYKNERTTKLFNENILVIEKAIAKVLKAKYKVIATDLEHWEKIKQEFNNKKKKYEYIEEDFDLDNLFNKKGNEEFGEFKDLIEYN